jgi:hypothetical protein
VAGGEATLSVKAKGSTIADNIYNVAETKTVGFTNNTDMY